MNLRGFDAREPLDPNQALHGFPLALGVDSKGVPSGLEDKASLYRTLIAERRMLIVLDNARSAEQVWPLLPGTSTCVALVTSRNRLDSLTIREGASRIGQDVYDTQ